MTEEDVVHPPNLYVSPDGTATIPMPPQYP